MYKLLLRTFLILLMLLNFTACSNTPTSFVTTVESGNFKVIKLDSFNMSDAEDILLEMLELSRTRTLSRADMHNMGLNFSSILSFSSEHNEEFEKYAYETFCNICEQATKWHISMEDLYSWTSVPVKEILIKYFTSKEFEPNTYIGCSGITKLEKSDAIEVVQTIFDIPCSDTYYEVIFNTIYLSQYPEVREMGLAKLLELSNSSKGNQDALRLCIYLDDDNYANDVLTAEISDQIRANILRNKHFNFVEKYTIFCNSSDDQIATHAFSHLLEVASHSDLENLRQIQQALEDAYMAEELLLTLENLAS